jgi:methionyl-tRNA formyltransferase
MSRVVFAGTPAFAAVALQAIARAGHEVLGVLTQPDRPAGRGMKLQASEVKRWAQAHDVPVLQPHGLRLDGRYADEAAAAQAQLQAWRPDVMVVAAYGLILPQWVLDLPRWGCLNIHASLLPRWRGAAPIHRAIEAGDAETGITIMQMDAGLDTGDILLTARVPIDEDATTADVHDELAALGGDLAVQALADAEVSRLQPEPQAQDGVCYAHKIDKAEAWLDWSLSATALARRVRAFNPFPGAAMRLGDAGDLVKVWAASARPSDQAGAAPGAVLAVGPEGVDIACGEGVLRCTELQRAGAKRMAVADFLRGHAWTAELAWPLARLIEAQS